MNASGNGPQAEGAGKREAPGAGPPCSNTGGKSPLRWHSGIILQPWL